MRVLNLGQPVAIVFFLALFLSVSTVSAQYVNRSPKLEPLRQTEPEIANYLSSWYDSIDEQIAKIIEDKAHWKTQLDNGVLDQSGYEMVYERDVTRKVAQLKASIPLMIQGAKQMIADIRSDEVFLYQAYSGVARGDSFTLTIKRNGVLESSTGQTKRLSQPQLAELQKLITAVPLPPQDQTPRLSHGWDNVVLYQNGIFRTHEHYHPKDPNRTKLLEFVETLRQD